jgi:hypothetical protein
MASGRLGAQKPAAATYKTLYKPSGVVAVCAVQACNQSTSDDNIRIAIAQSASSDPTPGSAEFVVYDGLIRAKGDQNFADKIGSPNFELNAAANDQIVVYSTNGNVSFVCTGDEGTV